MKLESMRNWIGCYYRVPTSQFVFRICSTLTPSIGWITTCMSGFYIRSSLLHTYGCIMNLYSISCIAPRHIQPYSIIYGYKTGYVYVCSYVPKYFYKNYYYGSNSLATSNIVYHYRGNMFYYCCTGFHSLTIVKLQLREILVRSTLFILALVASKLFNIAEITIILGLLFIC